jgi:hypothetical protein
MRSSTYYKPRNKSQQVRVYVCTGMRCEVSMLNFASIYKSTGDGGVEKEASSACNWREKVNKYYITYK